MLLGAVVAKRKCHFHHSIRSKTLLEGFLKLKVWSGFRVLYLKFQIGSFNLWHLIYILDLQWWLKTNIKSHFGGQINNTDPEIVIFLVLTKSYWYFFVLWISFVSFLAWLPCGNSKPFWSQLNQLFH